MNQPGRVIEEKRFVSVVFDESHGVVMRLVEWKSIGIQSEWIRGGIGGKIAESIGFHGYLNSATVTCEVKSLIAGLGESMMVFGDVPLATMSGGVAPFF